MNACVFSSSPQLYYCTVRTAGWFASGAILFVVCSRERLSGTTTIIIACCLWWIHGCSRMLTLTAALGTPDLLSTFCSCKLTTCSSCCHSSFRAFRLYPATVAKALMFVF